MHQQVPTHTRTCINSMKKTNYIYNYHVYTYNVDVVLSLLNSIKPCNK